MKQPRVWVVTPELHRKGGTERCLSEEVIRWQSRLSLTVFAQRVDEVMSGDNVKLVKSIRAPHLVAFWFWFVANSATRSIQSLVSGAPDVTVSPGANCLE